MLKKSLKIIIKTIFAILLIAIFPYIFSGIYEFPEIKQFSGDKIYNPYADTNGDWYKANFQAHSGAWGGITDGKISPRKLYDIYKNMGYDIVGLTNYQTITNPAPEDSSFIPMYEHGYNIKKRHHLLIGAKEVVWLDYIFLQTLHHKQDMLKKLRSTSEIITISHPKFSNSFEPVDFKYLTDYDFIEVLNHYRLSLPHWDSALSSGRLAWGMGDDDSHDQNKSDETGRYWNMIRSISNRPEEILGALKKGKNYCVSGWGGENLNLLKSLRIDTSNTIHIDLLRKAGIIRFIGQWGDTLGKIENSGHASFQIRKKDTYIRIEAETDSSTMYFNPVFRYSENPFHKKMATQNVFLTWVYRIVFFCLWLIAGYWLIRRKRVRFLNQ